MQPAYNYTQNPVYVQDMQGKWAFFPEGIVRELARLTKAVVSKQHGVVRSKGFMRPPMLVWSSIPEVDYKTCTASNGFNVFA